MMQEAFIYLCFVNRRGWVLVSFEYRPDDNKQCGALAIVSDDHEIMSLHGVVSATQIFKRDVFSFLL